MIIETTELANKSTKNKSTPSTYSYDATVEGNIDLRRPANRNAFAVDYYVFDLCLSIIGHLRVRSSSFYSSSINVDLKSKSSLFIRFY